MLIKKATIENNIHKNYEKNLITGVLSCDISRAFETCCHKILCQKLQFFGIRGQELKLLKSYLSNWYQFVEVDTFRSKTIKSLPFGCIQGSKLSGFLFTVYTLELPLVQKILKDPIFYQKMTGMEPPKFKLPKHELNTFVDDSFSTIAFDPNAKIKGYLEKYFELMFSYYNSNMLKLHPDKTQLMFVSKPKFRPLAKNVSFKAKTHVIKPSPSLKILGSILSHDLSNERELSHLIPILNNRINQFEKLKQYTDFHTQLQFSNSTITRCLV